jgi:hypothetical protein
VEVRISNAALIRVLHLKKLVLQRTRTSLRKMLTRGEASIVSDTIMMEPWWLQ